MVSVSVPPQNLPRKHVDDGELDERREDEDQTHDHPHVNGLDVRHPGKGGSGGGRREKYD